MVKNFLHPTWALDQDAITVPEVVCRVGHVRRGINLHRYGWNCILARANLRGCNLSLHISRWNGCNHIINGCNCILTSDHFLANFTLLEVIFDTCKSITYIC